MDDKTQKERLEQELRFLKESFEAEVISKEEYEKGKDRIEKKLKEIEIGAQDTKEENGKEKDAQKEEAEAKKEGLPEVGQEKAVEAPAKEPQASEPKIVQEAQKKENRLFKYAVVFVVLALVIFFSYSLLKAKPPVEKPSEVKFVSECSSDADCRQEGKEGKCLHTATKEAKCEFEEMQKTNVLVLNDRKSCFNCGTERVLSILESWFGELNAKEINYNTETGKVLAESINVSLLPAYVLDENITEKEAFEQFKRAFVKRDGMYVLSEDAAGSTFYFRRENIPNKLDLFVKQGDSASAKAEKNLQGFLDRFKDVKFEKHLSDSELAQELGIKNFPAFLINSKVKFSGVQTADTIKVNFCSLNKADACNETLSKSLA